MRNEVCETIKDGKLACVSGVDSLAPTQKYNMESGLNLGLGQQNNKGLIIEDPQVSNVSIFVNQFSTIVSLSLGDK